MRTRRTRFLVLISGFLLSCGADSDEVGEPIVIAFGAVVGDEPFVCGASYTGQGEADVTLVPTDLRYFVSDLAVITGDGTEVPIVLEGDGQWQFNDVALIDIEDGQGACDNGSAGLNAEVRGATAAGTIAGIAFTLGVPFELNHANPDRAAPPLSSTAMSWGWQGGYKFLRFEARAGDADYRVHLGSTGCEGTIGDIRGCMYPNRARIRIDTFDPATDRIVLDLEQLLGGVELTSNAPQTALGCMANWDDPDCEPVFDALGLELATGEVSGAQRAFRTVPR
jgi:uncharacterized repeat protein (TIGR04052 family)